MTDKSEKSNRNVARKTKSDGQLEKTPEVNAADFSREDHDFARYSLERAADAIFWVGPDAKILYANETAGRLLGYSQRELLSMKVFDIDPNFKEDMWPEHWEKTKTKGPYKIESAHRSKDGTETPMEIQVIYLEFGDKEYHIAYARPITDRKKAEEALRESESKFKLLSEQGLLAIVVLQDGMIKYANQAMADLTGFKVKTLIGLNESKFSRFIHPDDRDFVMEQAQKKQSGDDNVVNSHSFRIITSSNETKWVDVYSKTVTYEGRNADFVSIIDITDRIKAEEVLKKAHGELDFLVKERTVELTESNRQLKRRIFDLYTIFELSRNFNAVLNYETLLDSFVLTSLGQMGAAKAALYLPKEIGSKHFHVARVKGSPPFPRDEIYLDPDGNLGQYITALNRPVFIDDIVRKLKDSEDLTFLDYFERGLVVPLIFQTVLRGVLIISGKESGMRFQDEDIEFLSILANQTAVSIENARLYESEKEALAKLQQAQRLLLQSERLAVLGELSAKVAHEVNNPLGIITNYLQLLIRQTETDDKALEYVSAIKQEIERIKGIVRHLLEMGKPIHIKFTRTDIGTLLNEAITLIKRQLDKLGIEITLCVADGLPQIMAWPDGLKQVFMNMIINARDAIGATGEIMIEAIGKDHSIQIFISDTGPGIDPKHVPHIFEPFYSTKENGGGTGLGLSVSNSIIKSHNGTISLCTYGSEIRGGCFKIELPIEQEKEEHECRI